jgi:hypothetical protein
MGGATEHRRLVQLGRRLHFQLHLTLENALKRPTMSTELKMETKENQQLRREYSPWRLCTAPMMDWTDRHCRFFHRLLTHRTRLYTEMVTTGALLHGDVPRHLDYNDEEHPVALQLGGSEPQFRLTSS